MSDTPRPTGRDLYWLGSQTTEFVMLPSARVGSIGVVVVALDETELVAKAGVKVNAISAGVNKLEGAPWQRMSDETLAFLQDQVNTVNAGLVTDVASGRRVTVARIAAAEDTLARMLQGPGTRRGSGSRAIGAAADGDYRRTRLAVAKRRDSARAGRWCDQQSASTSIAGSASLPRACMFVRGSHKWERLASTSERPDGRYRRAVQPALRTKPSLLDN
jgi:hypothetical protein